MIESRTVPASCASRNTPRSAHPWRGRTQIGLGWAAFYGEGGDNAAHHHHAVQVVLGRGASVVVRVDGHEVEGPGFIIGADVLHAVAPGPVELLYLARESTAGRRVDPGPGSAYLALDADGCKRVRAAMRQHLVPGDPAGFSLVRALVPGVAESPLNEHDSVGRARVRALIGELPRRALAGVGTGELAREVALSGTRFARLMKAETGLALRPYLRWMRLVEALRAVVVDAHSITDAAHLAGFADSAHLARTMRRHFGISLSQMHEGSR